MIRSTTTKAAAEMEEEIVSRKNIRLERLPERVLARWMPVVVLLVMGYVRPALAQESGAKTFSSAAEASHALFLAVQNDNEQAVGAILGAGREVTSSNEEVEDKLERERFSQKYQEMHRLVREPDGSTVLYIGAENWPFPIPLVSKNGRWYFDSKAGTEEILFRRVGENEATAIQVCQAFAMAKKQPNSKPIEDDAISQYVQGLTGGTANDDNHTPASPGKESAPFHGYYFRLVTVNSAAFTNSYVAGGKKTGGLALVAYPAEYRSSGVMTFILTLDGSVYEKDLGPDTTKVASDIKDRSSDSSWRAAE